jgi:hypothetical protein
LPHESQKLRLNLPRAFFGYLERLGGRVQGRPVRPRAQKLIVAIQTFGLDRFPIQGVKLALVGKID